MNSAPLCLSKPLVTVAFLITLPFRERHFKGAARRGKTAPAESAGAVGLDED